MVAFPVSVPRRRPAVGALLAAATVMSGGLLLGGATSLGQLLLSDALRPLANSASGWTIFAVLLLLVLSRTGRLLTAVLGAVAFVSLTLGYTLVSEARGLPFSPDFWIPVGLVAGPVVGWAVWAVRGPALVPRSIGWGLLAGIMSGEGLYGLLFVAESTGIAYWVGVLILGAGAVSVGAAFAVRGLRPRLLLVGVAVVVTAAFPGAYFLLGSLPLL